MLKIFAILLLALIVQEAASQVCLYSPGSATTLKPLKLTKADCPLGKAKGCMFEVYNYGSFRYNGPKTLEPAMGEIVMFLSQDHLGRLDAVMIMNPVSDTRVETNLTITGAAPTNAIHIDDTNEGSFNSATNTGTFTYFVEPGKTDGFIVGHIDFLSKYCITANFEPIDAKDMTTVSILTGNVTHPRRIIQKPFVSGLDFSFCQYPGTQVTKTDAKCPGDLGSATVSITFGPAIDSIVWKNAQGVTISTTPSINNVAPGTYSFLLDSDGCKADNIVEILGYTAPTLSVVSVVDASSSSTGSATVEIMGGSAPYNFVWKKNGVQVSDTQSGSTSTATGLTQGTYKVNATDSCGVSVLIDVVVKLVNLDCPAGTYKSGNSCLVCPVGTYNNFTGQTACKTCPRNKYSPGGTICLACLLSRVSEPGSGKCAFCPPGTDRVPPAENCTTCAPGTYRCGGRSKCQQCPLGTFASAPGSLNCTPCDPGFFAQNLGSTACTRCPVGTYSSAGAGMCTPCPSGLTAPAGSTVVQHCM